MLASFKKGHSQDIESQADVKETEQKSLAYIKEGLALALDVIHVEKRLVTKQ